MHTDTSLFTHGYICSAVYIALLMNGFHTSIWSLCSDFTNDGLRELEIFEFVKAGLGGTRFKF